MVALGGGSPTVVALGGSDGVLGGVVVWCVWVWCMGVKRCGVVGVVVGWRLYIHRGV